MELIETPVLIIGSGIAGSIAALKLAEEGISVTLVSRSGTAPKSNTSWAQGGIIYKGTEDSPELLIQDILRAGAGHSFPPAAKILAEEGPVRVDEWLLGKVPVPFDHDPDGSLALVLEGGHSVPRILHATDATGLAIHNALMAALETNPLINFLNHHTAIELITPSHNSLDRQDIYGDPTCVGAYVFDRQKRSVMRVLAQQTILATGGLGQIFLTSTNPPSARGDGVAMAYRAGARVINMEFVQFHPTTFHKTGAPASLISEAVRGEGARLVDADGTPFMQNYEPEWKDLAPRDVVARAIYHHMLENDLTHVYLDLKSYISEDKILHHFPTIHKECLQYGVDITKDLVPVVPGAHYSCGGVWSDENGRSSLQNLFAIGEVACTGLHGANRLASTSLLEGLVWGHRAAEYIAKNISKVPKFNSKDIEPWKDEGQFAPDPALIQQDLSSIKNIMWNYVGLARTSYRLERALRELRHLESEIERFYRKTNLSDSVIGLRNAVRTAVLVASAAWENKSSVGCHFRE